MYGYLILTIFPRPNHCWHNETMKLKTICACVNNSFETRINNLFNLWFTSISLKLEINYAV